MKAFLSNGDGDQLRLKYTSNPPFWLDEMVTSETRSNHPSARLFASLSRGEEKENEEGKKD